MRESPPSHSKRQRGPPNNGGGKFGSESDDGKHGAVEMAAMCVEINREVQKT
jgi:hypothetical protein